MPAHKKDRAKIEAFVDQLDARILYRAGVLGDRERSMPPPFECQRIEKLVADRISVRIDWTHGAPRQMILLTWTRTSFGAYVPWFRCGCGKRVRKLYCYISRYRCRHCLKCPLYIAQSMGKKARIHRRICKLRLAMNGDARPTEAWPKRPRYMRQWKYDTNRRIAEYLLYQLPRRMRRKAVPYDSLLKYVR